MDRKKRIASVALSFIIVVLIVHMVYHFFVFGTGLTGFYEKGISGFSIGKFPLGEELRANYKSASPISKIILGIEWVAAVSIIIFIFIRNKKEIKKEVSSIKSPQKYKKTEKSTELDLLYNILKEKKHLRLSTIARIFDISKKTALDWAKTLESGNLVKIEYPRMSEPEIVLNEE